MARKYYRVTAFFPEAASPYAHMRLLVKASDFHIAIARALRTFRRHPNLKGKHLRRVEVTATEERNRSSEILTPASPVVENKSMERGET